ncbi:hypothetical protein GCM10023067_01720 [Aminobacter aganoensis]
MDQYRSIGLNIVNRDKQNRSRWFASFTAVAVLTTALSYGSAANAADGAIIVARALDVGTLDRDAGPGDMGNMVIRSILDPLVLLDRDASIKPGLAESWEISPDRLTYKFKIRSGLKCHDGTPFDAEAVKWNFERMARPETTGVSAIRNLDDASVEGDVAVIRFKTRNDAFIRALGALRYGMLCPSSDKADGTFAPIGTGPWKFISWTKNDKVRLERNDDYVNHDPWIENPGAPHEKFLEFRVVPENVARIAALRSGEVNFAEPSYEQVAELRNDPNYKIWAGEHSGQFAWGAFTLKVPPLDDRRVRQAVVHAMDRKTYSEIAFEGQNSPINCPAPPNLPFIDQDLCAQWGQSYDPEKAKALLAEAGYGPNNPLKLTISVHQLPGWDLMHQIMLQNLKDVGIDATLETREASAFMADIKEQNTRTEGIPITWTWGSSGLDPLSPYEQQFVGAGQFNGGLGAEMDKLVAEARSLEGDAQGKAIQNIMQYILSEAFVYPIVSPGWQFVIATKSSTTGFVYQYLNMMNFNDVKL